MKRQRISCRTERGWVIGLCAVCIGLAGAFLTGSPSEKEKLMQQEIAKNVLRFHVLADSNSREDQEEKLRVRDAVIEELQPVLKDSSSREETKRILKENTEEIQQIAEAVVWPKNVEVSLVKDWFPEKTYGDCTFPPGEYEALRIEIGKAGGRNWWCVLYPCLCFEDAVRGVVPRESKEELEQLLDGEAYDFILHPARTKIRFRWL